MELSYYQLAGSCSGLTSPWESPWRAPRGNARRRIIAYYPHAALKSALHDALRGGFDLEYGSAIHGPRRDLLLQFMVVVVGKDLGFSFRRPFRGG